MRPAIRNILLGGRLRFNFMGGTMPANTALTRASTGWRVNSSGVIVSALTDVARFTYDPATLAVQGLLNEPARTNLVTTSQVWNGAGTTRTNYTVADNQIVAPDGTTTGAKFTENGTNGIHDVYKTATVTSSAGAEISYSAFFQAGTRASGYLNYATGSGVDYFAKGFNLTTIAVGQTKTGTTGTLTVASIIDFGNSWRRGAISGHNADANGQAIFSFPPNPASITIDAGGFGEPTWAGDNASLAYAWGHQFEIGALPSSYIPTTSAAVTRAADVLTLSGIPNGTYTVDVVRLSGTTTLTGQVVSAGTFVVPTDVSPLQAVQNWVRTA